MSQCSSGENLVLLASVAAVSISQELSKNDLIILSDFLSILGGNLAMIAAQREIQEAGNTAIPKASVIPPEFAR